MCPKALKCPHELKTHRQRQERIAAKHPLRGRAGVPCCIGYAIAHMKYAVFKIYTVLVYYKYTTNVLLILYHTISTIGLTVGKVFQELLDATYRRARAPETSETP